MIFDDSRDATPKILGVQWKKQDASVKIGHIGKIALKVTFGTCQTGFI
jgi:hypothetical protein